MKSGFNSLSPSHFFSFLVPGFEKWEGPQAATAECDVQTPRSPPKGASHIPVGISEQISQRPLQLRELEMIAAGQGGSGQYFLAVQKKLLRHLSKHQLQGQTGDR